MSRLSESLTHRPYENRNFSHNGFFKINCIIIVLLLLLKCQSKLDGLMKIWKAKEIINLIEADGWFLARQKGSHKHYRHLTKQGTVTVPYSGNDDLPPGTANSILKQAGLK